MKLLRNELPLMSFVVAITILQLLPGLLLIQRRAAISAKVTPPMNMTSTVLCCLLGAPAPHCTCGIVSRSDHPAAKTRASYIRVLQSLECFLEGSYGGALSGGGGGGAQPRLPSPVWIFWCMIPSKYCRKAVSIRSRSENAASLTAIQGCCNTLAES